VEKRCKRRNGPFPYSNLLTIVSSFFLLLELGTEYFQIVGNPKRQSKKRATIIKCCGIKKCVGKYKKATKKQSPAKFNNTLSSERVTKIIKDQLTTTIVNFYFILEYEFKKNKSRRRNWKKLKSQKLKLK